jgi:hypothetical protein
MNESYEIIEITFHSGETITYKNNEWYDYSYDGKAFVVKKGCAWIGIYNFSDILCVEVK